MFASFTQESQVSHTTGEPEEASSWRVSAVLKAFFKFGSLKLALSKSLESDAFKTLRLKIEFNLEIKIFQKRPRLIRN